MPELYGPKVSPNNGLDTVVDLAPFTGTEIHVGPNQNPAIPGDPAISRVGVSSTRQGRADGDDAFGQAALGRIDQAMGCDNSRGALRQDL